MNNGEWKMNNEQWQVFSVVPNELPSPLSFDCNYSFDTFASFALQFSESYHKGW